MVIKVHLNTLLDIYEVKVFPVPLGIKQPQMNGHVKYFDNNSKFINLLVHDQEMLKNYNEICDKNKNLFKKRIW